MHRYVRGLLAGRIARRVTRGAFTTAVVALALAIPSPVVASPTKAAVAAGTPSWIRQIDAIVQGQPVSVSIGVDGAWLYRKRGEVLRTPASNEKLLLSMALLDRVDPETTIPTRASTKKAPLDGVVRGNLWILGHGDPEGGNDQMTDLAKAIVAAGIHRIRGSVIGDEGPFARDDWAPGWLDFFPSTVIPIATALTYHGNVDIHGRLVSDPERRAAKSLTHALTKRGVRVVGAPRMGHAPNGMVRVATIESAPLRAIMSRMDHASINFDAEVLGKYLGQLAKGEPGEIAKGAAAISGFAAKRGVQVISYDGSGLSYDNRVTSDRIVRLLWFAGAQPWAPTLMNALPSGGQGTLEGRLTWVKIHAKTGTLINVSALSGWVWMQRSGSWAEFSILSHGLTKETAVQIENKIARTISRSAEPPGP